MPTYRVYYAERQLGASDTSDSFSQMPTVRGTRPTDYHSDTEWEEEVEGRNTSEALEAFFREHVRDRREVRWVDERGESRPIEGVSDYESDKAYIWIEDQKLMEYQGIDEATPGMVACPLCDGAGEVTLETADEYLAGSDEELTEEGSWG